MNDFYIFIILIFILLIILIYLNNREKYYNWMYQFKNQELNIDDFFFSDIKHLNKSNKRKLWIYVPITKNNRKWESFYSRTTNNLNCDYIALCIKSIIDRCGQYYDIIIVDDSNLYKLLPEHNVDINKISGSLLDKYRQYALLNILYKYGGVIVPSSLYLRKSIYNIDKPDTFFVCELVNQGKHSNMDDYIYSTELMGSNKNNPILSSYIDKYSKQCLNDLTLENDYFNKQLLQEMDIPKLDGKYIGVKTINNDKILLEDLMSTKELEICNDSVGLYIPHQELLKRNHYNWYVYLNKEEVLESNVFVSKFMLKSNEFK